MTRAIFTNTFKLFKNTVYNLKLITMIFYASMNVINHYRIQNYCFMIICDDLDLGNHWLIFYLNIFNSMWFMDLLILCTSFYFRIRCKKKLLIFKYNLEKRKLFMEFFVAV